MNTRQYDRKKGTLKCTIEPIELRRRRCYYCGYPEMTLVTPKNHKYQRRDPAKRLVHGDLSCLLLVGLNNLECEDLAVVGWIRHRVNQLMQ